MGVLVVTFDRPTLDRLFRYCLALAGNREDAEDLLHTALERFLRKRPDEVAEPVAYIRRIARNHHFDRLRRVRVVQMEALDNPALHAEVEHDLESVMVDRLRVERVWGLLSPAEREVVYLWAVEGMSAREIAQHLDLPRGTVLSRLHRLRLRAAEELQGEDNHGRA
jgi:RNA polymerase sigma factor (sigma-70 family)